MKALDGETRESRRMVPHVKLSRSVGLDICCHYRTRSKLCRDEPVTLWEDKCATRDWVLPHVFPGHTRSNVLRKAGLTYETGMMNVAGVDGSSESPIGVRSSEGRFPA